MASVTHSVESVTGMFVLALKRAACVQCGGREVVLGGSWPSALPVQDCSTRPVAAKKNDSPHSMVIS
jgi:hypothetical protein